MIEFLKNPVWLVYAELALATAINMVTIYCVNKAEGFTRFWPTIGVIVSISLVQFFVSRAIASGMDTSQAVTSVIVCVIIGSILIGTFVFQESLPPQKIAGMALAILGVVIASTAKS